MFDSVSFVTIVDCEDDVNKRRKIHVLFGIQTSKEESAWIGLRQDYRGNKYVWHGRTDPRQTKPAGNTV